MGMLDWLTGSDEPTLLEGSLDKYFRDNEHRVMGARSKMRLSPELKAAAEAGEARRRQRQELMQSQAMLMPGNAPFGTYLKPDMVPGSAEDPDIGSRMSQMIAGIGSEFLPGAGLNDYMRMGHKYWGTGADAFGEGDYGRAASDWLQAGASLGDAGLDVLPAAIPAAAAVAWPLRAAYKGLKGAMEPRMVRNAGELWANQSGTLGPGPGHNGGPLMTGGEQPDAPQYFSGLVKRLEQLKEAGPQTPEQVLAAIKKGSPEAPGAQAELNMGLEFEGKDATPEDWAARFNLPLFGPHAEIDGMLKWARGYTPQRLDTEVHGGESQWTMSHEPENISEAYDDYEVFGENEGWGSLDLYEMRASHVDGEEMGVTIRQHIDLADMHRGTSRQSPDDVERAGEIYDFAGEIKHEASKMLREGKIDGDALDEITLRADELIDASRVSDDSDDLGAAHNSLTELRQAFGEEAFDKWAEANNYMEYAIRDEGYGSVDWERSLTAARDNALSRLNEFRSGSGADGTQWSSMVHPKVQGGLSDYYEKQYAQSGYEHGGGHWDNEEVIMHARGGSIEDIDGNKGKILFEGQADPTASAMGGDNPPGFTDEKVHVFDPVSGDIVKKFDTEEEAQDFIAKWEELNPQEGMLDYDSPGDRDSIPRPEYSTNWANYIIKDHIWEAVQRGDERVFWATGRTQAEFNRKTRPYSSITLTPKIVDGTWDKQTVVVETAGRGMVSAHSATGKQELKLSSLADHIGDEHAAALKKQIKESKFDPSLPKEFFLDNVDGAIGGPFHRRVYNKNMKQTAEAIAKRFGGKIGRTWMKTGEGDVTFTVVDDALTWQGSFDSEAAARAHAEKVGGTIEVKGGHPVWYLDLPEAARKAIKATGFSKYGKYAVPVAATAGAAAATQREDRPGI